MVLKHATGAPRCFVPPPCRDTPGPAGFLILNSIHNLYDALDHYHGAINDAQVRVLARNPALWGDIAWEAKYQDPDDWEWSMADQCLTLVAAGIGTIPGTA